MQMHFIKRHFKRLEENLTSSGRTIGNIVFDFDENGNRYIDESLSSNKQGMFKEWNKLYIAANQQRSSSLVPGHQAAERARQRRNERASSTIERRRTVQTTRTALKRKLELDARNEEFHRRVDRKFRKAALTAFQSCASSSRTTATLMKGIFQLQSNQPLTADINNAVGQIIDPGSETIDITPPPSPTIEPENNNNGQAEAKNGDDLSDEDDDDQENY